MTPEEALAKAKEIAGPTNDRVIQGRLERQILGNTEWIHSDLDDLLCEILKEHGYGDLVEFYQSLELWYS